MNFQRSIGKDVAGGVRIGDGEAVALGARPLDLGAGAGPIARRVADGDDLSVGARSRAPAPIARSATSPVPATGGSDPLHRPGRRIPDADIVIVGRRPSDPPSPQLRSFRRKVLGFSLAGLLVFGAALHLVRVNNLLGWTPIAIEDVVPQEV